MQGKIHVIEKRGGHYTILGRHKWEYTKSPDTVEIIDNLLDMELALFYFTTACKHKSNKDNRQQCAFWWMHSSKEEKDSWRLILSLTGDKSYANKLS